MSVTGKLQAKAYCKQAGVHYNPKKSNTTFRFGDGSFKSLEKIPIRIPTPNNSYISIGMDIVGAEIPMLIGIDVLDKERLNADNVNNQLIQADDRWRLG